MRVVQRDSSNLAEHRHTRAIAERQHLPWLKNHATVSILTFLQQVKQLPRCLGTHRYRVPCRPIEPAGDRLLGTQPGKPVPCRLTGPGRQWPGYVPKRVIVLLDGNVTDRSVIYYHAGVHDGRPYRPNGRAGQGDCRWCHHRAAYPKKLSGNINTSTILVENHLYREQAPVDPGDDISRTAGNGPACIPGQHVE